VRGGRDAGRGDRGGERVRIQKEIVLILGSGRGDFSEIFNLLGGGWWEERKNEKIQ